MRALAEFIMRGRMQATLVVVVSAALPLLFWLSAAAGSLVLLRRGWSDAIGILVWALLPAIGWWYFGEPRTLLVLLGALGLALLLRANLSWNRVLLCSVALGLVYGLVLGAVFREPIEAMALELQKLMPQMLEGVHQQMSVDERARLDSLIAPVLTGLMLLLVGMLLGPNLGPQMAMLTPLCSVPLAFAGIALLHGVVAQGRLGKFWLVGLYITLLLFMQLTYPLLVVLAIVDSLFDFRGRFERKQGSGPTNGEG